MFFAICVGPYNKIKPMLWVDMFLQWDVKRWTIAKEKGKGGYEHWQVRIACSGKYTEFFNWMQERTQGVLHVEESQSWSDYERKEGHFYTSEDTARIRHQRFGTPRWYQKAVIDAVKETNDREIVVWVDEGGNLGKSWTCAHLWETGQAYVLNPMGQARSLVQDVLQYVQGRRTRNPSNQHTAYLEMDRRPTSGHRDHQRRPTIGPKIQQHDSKQGHQNISHNKRTTKTGQTIARQVDNHAHGQRNGTHVRNQIPHGRRKEARVLMHDEPGGLRMKMYWKDGL